MQKRVVNKFLAFKTMWVEKICYFCDSNYNSYWDYCDDKILKSIY